MTGFNRYFGCPHFLGEVTRYTLHHTTGKVACHLLPCRTGHHDGSTGGWLMLEAISVRAFISGEYGTYSPCCPSTSYTVISTGIMLPSNSMDVTFNCNLPL